MKEKINKIKKYLITIVIPIICIILLNVAKNYVIAAGNVEPSISQLMNMDSSQVSNYIGSWTTDGYKYFGVIYLNANTGIGCTYTNTGGYSQLADNNKEFAAAAYLANINPVGDKLRKAWNKVYPSLKSLMSGSVADAFKSISESGNAEDEYKEAERYAEFCEKIRSGKIIDAYDNGGKLKVNGNKVGPITLTSLVKDKKGEYKYTDGTQNKIIIEAKIKGTTKKITYDVTTGEISGNTGNIKLDGISIENISAGKTFSLRINGIGSFTSKDIKYVRIYNSYKLYKASVLLFAKQGAVKVVATTSGSSSGQIGAGSEETGDYVEFFGEGSGNESTGSQPSSKTDKDADFALRKAITSITRANGTTEPVGGESRGLGYSVGWLTNYAGESGNPINKYAETTAKYNGKAGAINVKVGDKITYTIRVYNEGKEDAQCPAITDYIPKGLKVTDNSKSAGWIKTGTRNINGVEYTAYTIRLSKTIKKFEEYKAVQYYGKFETKTKTEMKYVGKGKGTYKKTSQGGYVYVAPGKGDYDNVTTTKEEEVTRKDNRKPEYEVEGQTGWKAIDGDIRQEFVKDRTKLKLDYTSVQIECEVDKIGGGYLYNYAEISGLTDRDSTANNIGRKKEDDDDYDVVHKLVDIGGIAFIDGTLTKDQDKFANGYYNSGEAPKDKVRVILSNGQTTTTDSSGRYKFLNLPSENSYSVTFEYDGVEYIATKYTHTGSGNETSDNDAQEDGSKRTKLNGTFSEISHEFLQTNPSKTITASTIFHKGIESTDLLAHLNLGLIKRTKVDLSLYNDVLKTEIKINEKSEAYTYNSVGEARQSIWYDDLKWQGTTYHQDIHETDIDTNKTNTFEAYITYRITVNNESSTQAALTEIVDYYDKNYVFYGVEARTSKGETLRAIPTNTTMYAGLVNNTKISNVNYNNNDYKAIYIQLPDKKKLNNAEQWIIDITFKLNDAANTLKKQFDNKQNLKTNNYAEIKGFSTAGNNIYRQGVLEEDSEPGNYVISRTSEDDNNKSPVIFYNKISAREITGNVWEAININNNIRDGADIKTNTELLQYVGENGIEGIKVELVELTKDGELKVKDRDCITTTDRNGNYTIKNYIPGNYFIRFTYGGDCKTKSSTIKYNYDGQDFDAMFNGQNYQSTKANPNENIKTDGHKYWYVQDTGVRYSDAYDDAICRLAQIKELEEYSFEKVRKLFNQDDEEYINTEMYAYTGKMELEVEKAKTTTKYNDNHTYKIENIDFGLTPRTETKVSIEKNITHVKLTLANGKVQIDADIAEIQAGKIKGITAPQAVNIELEDELVQGAILELTYEVKVQNNSKEEVLSLYRDKDKNVVAITYYQEAKENLTAYEGDGNVLVTNGNTKSKYYTANIKDVIKRDNEVEIKQLVDHSISLYTDTELEENLWKRDLANTTIRKDDKNDKRFKDQYDIREEATCVLLDKGKVKLKAKGNEKDVQKIITSVTLSPRTSANYDFTYDNNAVITILGSNTGRITDITKIHTKSEETNLMDPTGKNGFSRSEFIIAGIIMIIFGIGIVLIKKFVLDKK